MTSLTPRHDPIRGHVIDRIALDTLHARAMTDHNWGLKTHTLFTAQKTCISLARGTTVSEFPIVIFDDFFIHDDQFIFFAIWWIPWLDALYVIAFLKTKLMSIVTDVRLL